MKTAIRLFVVAAAMASSGANAQGTGERPQRYGNTSSFFFYDGRADHRDFPTNGAFPGNFAADRFWAPVGAEGWLSGNPQHQARPYPSQTYSVDVGRLPVCQRYVAEPGAGVRPRNLRCLP